jgi:hypothetical protein
MNCEEASLHLLAAPATLSASVSEHVAGCDACAARLRAAAAAERDLRRAFELPVPRRRAGRAPLTRRTTAIRWALAASLGAAALLGVWVALPSPSLAAAVTAHVEGEPASWSASQRIAQPVVDQILGAAGMRLDSTATDVVYAQSCWFRGHWIPHLVVKTAQGPVTVLVLAAEHVNTLEPFKRDGFEGMLVPFAHGGLAVLGRDAGAVSPAVLEQLRTSLHPT